MNNLYIITGPAGVGKSTISIGIAEKLEKSFLVEGDNIYNMVIGGQVKPWLEGNHLEFFWKNVIDLIQNGLENGFDVVFNYILSKDQIENIKQSFPDAKIKFVVLMTDEKTLLDRDKLRPEDCQMGERCLVLLDEMKKKSFEEKNILITSNQTPEQSIQEILINNRFEIN